MKKIFIFIIIFFLVSCGKSVELEKIENKTQEIENLENKYLENIYLSSCRNSECFFQTIENIKNDFLKKCILENINLNKNFSEKLKNNNLEKWEFFSLNNLEAECIYNNEVLKTKEIPIFKEFIEKEIFIIVEKKELFFDYYFNSKEKDDFYFGNGKMGGWEKYNEKMTKQREENLKEYGFEIDYLDIEKKYLIDKMEAEFYLKSIEKENDRNLKRKKLYIINNYLRTKK